MSSLTKALDDLDEEVRARVLRWASERYGVSAAAPRLRTPDAGGASNAPDPSMLEFPDVAALMDATSPKTGVDRALVAGYWFQALKGESDFTGQAVNDELKHLGVGLPNVTDSFNTLMRRKPALAMQVQKSGRSKQARKRYRLTEAGLRRVRALMVGASTEAE